MHNGIPPSIQPTGLRQARKQLNGLPDDTVAEPTLALLTDIRNTETKTKWYLESLKCGAAGTPITFLIWISHQGSLSEGILV
jgi:hypothetical protein